MKHPVSYDEWLAYVDSDLPVDAARRVLGHIGQCRECQKLCDQLMAATTGLRDAAAEFASGHTVGGDAVSRSRERVLTRIRMEKPAVGLETLAGGELSIARLRRLQRVVAPVCGAQTAFRLIVAAVSRTPARGNWDTFLDRLTELTSALCGRSVAQLVLQIGSSLH